MAFIVILKMPLTTGKRTRVIQMLSCKPCWLVVRIAQSAKARFKGSMNKMSQIAALGGRGFEPHLGIPSFSVSFIPAYFFLHFSSLNKALLVVL